MTSQVTITPVNPAGAPLALELVGVDALTGGVGGWESLPRARRSPAAGWVGLPDTTYVLPLMLDGTRDDGGASSIEAKVRQVEGWATPTRATGEPPILTLSGPLVVPATSRWVLQERTWDGHERNEDGVRVQQLLTLTFLLYFEPRLVASPAKRRRTRSKGKKKKDGKGTGKKKGGKK